MRSSDVRAFAVISSGLRDRLAAIGDTNQTPAEQLRVLQHITTTIDIMEDVGDDTTETDQAVKLMGRYGRAMTQLVETITVGWDGIVVDHERAFRRNLSAVRILGSLLAASVLANAVLGFLLLRF